MLGYPRQPADCKMQGKVVRLAWSCRYLTVTYSFPSISSCGGYKELSGVELDTCMGVETYISFVFPLLFFFFFFLSLSFFPNERLPGNRRR